MLPTKRLSRQIGALSRGGRPGPAGEKRKDWWDKAAIIASIFSSVVIAAVALLLNSSLQRHQIEAAREAARVQVEAARTQVERAERAEHTRSIIDTLRLIPGDPHTGALQALVDNTKLAVLLDKRGLERFREIEEEFGPCRNDISTACQRRAAATINALRRFMGREEVQEDVVISFVLGNGLLAAVQAVMKEGEPWPPVERPASPAPPQAPAMQTAQAQPARTYFVFFDRNTADFTERAKEILSEAVQNSRRLGADYIDVAGHTDASEGLPRHSERSAQRLSELRVSAVVGFMKNLGVPEDRIRASAFGDSRMPVPTGRNVQEALNRRVEIVLRDHQ